MEREKMKIKMKPENDIEMRLSVVETILMEKIKRQSKNAIRIIKTEVEDEEEINKLENHALEQDLVHHSKMMETEKEIEALKQKAQMDNRTIEEMRSRVSESEIREQNLKEYNTEANQTIEELRRRISACEEQKKTADLVLEEMKIKETENFQCLEDFRRKNSEADRKVEELGGRVSGLEEEKRTAVRVLEEMKVIETDSKRRLEGLEREKLETDKRMNEMKVRESDLRMQISEADNRVKEMKGRSLEACKAVEENIKRFVNVLPIAEDLCKLLKMNVDDLVSSKDKFVSVDSRNGATTTNREAGPHASNKAVSATEQRTKKRKTQTMPSSAAVIIDFIDCDDEEFFSSRSYGISPLIPKRKRSKRAVRANESLIKRKRMFGEDMVRAFEEDDKLCLHAVCALYKQHFSSKRFYHFKSLRGGALADYLTIPVDEVKQRYPDIVNQCRRLAIHYSSYFTAEVPRTYEPLSHSLKLVCCHRYEPTHTHVSACETCARWERAKTWK